MISQRISEKDRWKYTKKNFYLIIGLPIIFWALAFPFIRIGLRYLSPVNLTILRFLVVCIVFIFTLLFMPKKFSKLHISDIPSIFLLGFFGVTVYHLGLNYGEQYVSASTASLIIAFIPILVVILAAFFLDEKIKQNMFFGIILSLLGVVILSISGSGTRAFFEGTYAVGVLTTFIAALMGAIYTVAGKKLLKRYSPLSLTVYAMLFGSLGLIPFFTPSLLTEIKSMTVEGWTAVIFLGVFSTVIGYVLWYVALEIKNASEVSMYLYSIPILSTIISCLFFGEKITVLFILGGFLVISGLIMVDKYSR